MVRRAGGGMSGERRAPLTLAERRQEAAAKRKALVVGTIITLLVGGIILSLVVRFASQQPDRANLGDAVFRVGRADRIAREIGQRGPSLFQDPLQRGTGRNLFVQHLGDDPKTGWLAIEARAPGAATECQLQWQGPQRRFLDLCSQRTYPADGAGLTTYPGRVDDEGVAEIDLRSPAAP